MAAAKERGIQTGTHELRRPIRWGDWNRLTSCSHSADPNSSVTFNACCTFHRTETYRWNLERFSAEQCNAVRESEIRHPPRWRTRNTRTYGLPLCRCRREDKFSVRKFFLPPSLRPQVSCSATSRNHFPLERRKSVYGCFEQNESSAIAIQAPAPSSEHPLPSRWQRNSDLARHPARPQLHQTSFQPPRFYSTERTSAISTIPKLPAGHRGDPSLTTEPLLSPPQTYRLASSPQQSHRQCTDPPMHSAPGLAGKGQRTPIRDLQTAVLGRRMRSYLSCRVRFRGYRRLPETALSLWVCTTLHAG